ncbi:hypothetical protein BH09VER1_BH09VER1_34640 [soil metagenome]
MKKTLKISNRLGFALVIMLALVVLLTGLVLAFFSYSSLQRQIGNASSKQATADLFAQGAINTIIAGFKQEIATGSTNYTIGTNTVSIPLASSNAAPFLVGTSTNLPNLIKRSANGLPFYPGGTNMAAANSTTNSSQNGRSISLARWNAAMLLPKANTNSTDLTPTNFTAPDWILVNRAGANPTTWNTNMRWTEVATNTTTVVGRYAYAIYNEGGLLDVNVAGYPPGVASNTLTTYKNTVASADLTQVGLSTNVIAALVGWRNAASAQPVGSFPNYSFSAVSQTNFFKNVSSNSFGFLRPANTNVVAGESDRMFVSRQQLMQFMSALADSGLQTKAAAQNAAQYLGTFSRALEQPSFAPNPKRPSIVGTSIPPAPASVNSYQGNNTYYGGESAINLTAGGFLSVRVQNVFTRRNGAQAVVGEPLVKTKFALSNLARVTTTATASASASDPIYSRFGLTRATTASPWVYNHGSTIIMTLSQVAALTGSNAREPDFAELLKAAVNVGSVGKSGPSGQGSNDQYRMDVSGDVQILQIMANLIDQQKTDNYPTRIQYTQNFQSSNIVRTVYGDQDLPYFYRWNFYGFTTKLPSPLLTWNDKVTFGSGTNSVDVRHTITGTLVNSGSAAYMLIPQIWNPHDANTPVASGGGPTTFRITAETNFPGGNPFSAWGINAVPAAGTTNFDGGDYTAANPPSSAKSPTLYMNPANSFIQFVDASGGKAFREPTILWRNNFPAGVTLTGTSRKEDSSLTGNTYYGILVGETPISWTWLDSGTSYVSQTSTLRMGQAVPGISGSQVENMTFRMQYLDPSGSWVTYQETYVESGLRDHPSYSLHVNKDDTAYVGNSKWANPLATGYGTSPPFERQQSATYDPRTNRFTAPADGSYNGDDPTLNGNPTLDAVTMVANNAPDASQNAAVASSNFVLMKTQRPTTAGGQPWNYLTPCRGYDSTMHWYTSLSTTVGGNNGLHNGSDANCLDGLLSQNNPAVKVPSANGGTIQSYYYEDPDGVARRAMGAYVGVSPTNPSGKLTNTTTTVGLPMATSGSSFAGGIVTPSSQSQSRAIILHRPFRSVAEMSYAFRGTPWKNIDFFTPESGDTALLDVFCVNEPPADALVAGKVDLNTHQAPVLKALFSGANRDEFALFPTPPASGTLPALSANEVNNLANTLVGLTSNTANSWQGPLVNIGDIVGHFVYPDPGALATSVKDVFQYTSPANSTRYTFSGFSAALSDTTIWDASNVTSTQNIQRFREAAIRPLADCGQTRVWNLLIDVVAQIGRYSPSATGLDQFVVEGEQRYWVHVAIDRYTGQIIDKQLELVSE